MCLLSVPHVQVNLPHESGVGASLLPCSLESPLKTGITCLLRVCRSAVTTPQTPVKDPVPLMVPIWGSRFWEGSVSWASSPSPARGPAWPSGLSDGAQPPLCSVSRLLAITFCWLLGCTGCSVVCGCPGHSSRSSLPPNASRRRTSPPSSVCPSLFSDFRDDFL